MRRVRWGWVALAVLVGMTACAGESDNEIFDRAEPGTTTTAAANPPAATGADEDEPMEVLWSTEEGIRFASSPVEIVGAGAAVAYIVHEGTLAVAAFDPATGAERWRRPSTASNLTEGVPLSVAGDGRRVYHLSPSPEGHAVEAIDATTGEALWTSPVAADGFSDAVRPCDPNGETLCVTAAGDDGGLWQVDRNSGSLIEPAGRPLGHPRAAGQRPIHAHNRMQVTGRALGASLYDLAGSGDIARVVDGQIVWQRSPSDLFGGADVDPDYGWSFREHGQLIVGTLGAVTDYPRNGTIELPVQRTAGIDSATGETRWITEGDPICGRLTNLRFVFGHTPPTVRCHPVGTMTFEDQTVTGYEVAAATMEMFNVTTGETTWSVDLGPSSALWDTGRVLMRLDTTSFAFVRDDGTVFGLDVRNGIVLELTMDDIGWCFGDNDIHYVGVDGPVQRRGEPYVTPCNMAGERQPAPLRPDDELGITIGDVFIWMDEAGLHGARVGG